MQFLKRSLAFVVVAWWLAPFALAQDANGTASNQTSEPSTAQNSADVRADVKSDAMAAEDQLARLTGSLGDYWQRELFTFASQEFHLGHLIRAALVFLLALIAAWIVRTILRRTVIAHFEKHAAASETALDDAALAVFHQTKRFIVILLAIYLALITLPLPEASIEFLHKAAMVLLTIQAAIWANAGLAGLLDNTIKRNAEKDPAAASAFSLMGFFARVAVWSLAVLLALSALDYPIGPLLAGLGVGGVAVAFALQHILGDIFCSIAIVLDKPFVLGDFIIVGDYMGSVEHIGIKTTRLRSLSGEQIVFSNADLIGSRVRNYKRMFQRRIVFAFGVVYELPMDKLQTIPETVQSIIESIDGTRFDRAHFKEYGDFSLNFEVVYHVLVPDFNKYMDIQQEINLRLFESFEKDGIAFAYPTKEIIMRPAG